MTLEEAVARAKELEGEVNQLKAEAEKQKGIAANAEKKFNEWSNEIGDLRKKSKADDDKISELLKQLGEAGSEGAGKKKTEGGKQETAEDIEASLGDEQKQAVEAAYKAAPDDVKLKYQKDEQFRAKFLAEARDRIQVIPESPWSKPDKKKAESKGGDVESIKSLFDKVIKHERHLPPGGSGTAQRGGGGQQEATKRVMLDGSDLLGSLERVRGK